ncbi:MAG: sugar transferase [candidate division Zixibacteria bacterium]
MYSNSVGAQQIADLTIDKTGSLTAVEDKNLVSIALSLGIEKGNQGNSILGILMSYIILGVTLMISVFRHWLAVIPRYAFNRAYLKRSVDIFGALVGLILTLPVFIILPILIKLDSPGPIFYKQLRVGQNRRRDGRRQENGSKLGRNGRDRRRMNLHGTPFHVYKFRTMVPEAEKKCGAVWATRNDPRVTRLGRFMRKSRLDEIPQFVNILLGQMSLVGPRPERPKFVEELSAQVDNYKKRLDVKPGLTGLAQIENGYDSSVASVVRKVQYDLQYIQKWSIWQDFKIMLRTVLAVITGKIS